MKTYNVKYDVGQEVYIISKKSIFKSRIDKIRVVQQSPYGLINGSKQQEEDAKTGICVEYLVVTEIIQMSLDNPQSQRIGYDWYNQSDVFSNRDELISQIK